MKNKNNILTILVTGGSGFLGSHVTESLISTGYKVKIFDTKTPPLELSNAEFCHSDLLNQSAVNEAMSGVDIVFHLAALADLDKAKDSPLQTMMVNVIGTNNILEAARKHNVKQVIFSSSIYVHSNTGGFYRVSKHCCELLLEEYFNQYDLGYTILRFGTLYGPRSDKSNSVYNYLHEALKKRVINSVGNGNEVREYIDVRDAADICIKLLQEPHKGETLILTGNHRMKLSELLEMINEILGNNIKIKFGDGKPAHYKYTPYSYKPVAGKKLVMDSYRDMGQGLVEILDEIDNKSKSN